MNPIIQTTPRGLYCSAGDFYIDPWLPVPRAVITHAHGDHARSGSKVYYCSAIAEGLMRKRIGQDSKIHALPYRETFSLGRAEISLHSAGHILGSSQVRVAVGNEVWVASGDYKRGFDPSCDAFDPVECDTFITESTFGYPVYRWDAGSVTASEILAWWDKNRSEGKVSILFCYALGKAQRVLAELKAITDRTVLTHGAVENLNECYRAAGIGLLPTRPVSETDPKGSYEGELVLAPPSAAGSSWLRRFRDVSTAFASGWMRIRGNRRRRGYERGFVLSDHADWPELVATVTETKAKRILVTHGASDTLVRYLCERGVDARPLATAYEGESEA